MDTDSGMSWTWRVAHFYKTWTHNRIADFGLTIALYYLVVYSVHVLSGDWMITGLALVFVMFYTTHQYFYGWFDGLQRGVDTSAVLLNVILEEIRNSEEEIEDGKEND